MDRPPFLFMMRLLVIFAAAMPWQGTLHAAPAAAQGYRLAGTVAVGSGFIAFLEVPGGGQVLVRGGDVVGTARVATIRDRAVELVLPGGRLELALEGSGKPAAAAPARDVVVGQSSAGHVHQREVDVEPLRRSLEGSPGGKGDPATVLGRKFAPVLNLPAQGRVLDVNGRPVADVDVALRAIHETLDSGGIVYMTLQTPGGIERVYLTPQRPETGSSAP